MKGRKVFQGDCLNDFMSLSRPHWKEVRHTIQALFANGSKLADNNDINGKVLHKISDVNLHLPAKIGDYTDFYSSRSHAFNVGSIIRGPANALNENWVIISSDLVANSDWLSWTFFFNCCQWNRSQKA